MNATVELWTLPSGARFALLDDDGTRRRTGTLIYANECRARVRYDASARHVVIQDGAQVAAEFDTPGRPVDIAACTIVMQIE
jgi:hypothetical protein